MSAVAGAFVMASLVFLVGGVLLGAAAPVIGYAGLVLSSAVLLAAGSTLWRRARAVETSDAEPDTRTLGAFQLGQVIDERGMGRTHRAQHPYIRRPTAIKMLTTRDMDRAIMARVRRDVEASCRLAHPNFAAVYDVGEDDGYFFYVTEHVDGLDLETLVSTQGSMPASRVVHILAQVCSAMHEAHGHGLLHRDLTPANIVLSHRGGIPDFVTVINLGLAERVDADITLRSGQMIAGTPAFVSPEVAMGRPASPLSDVYALGAVGYYLLTGERVFEGRSPADFIEQHLYDTPIPPSRRTDRYVPRSLENLLLSCLDKDPEKRPRDMRALGKALESLAHLCPWDEVKAERWWREHERDPHRDPHRDLHRDLHNDRDATAEAADVPVVSAATQPDVWAGIPEPMSGEFSLAPLAVAPSGSTGVRADTGEPARAVAVRHVAPTPAVSDTPGPTASVVEHDGVVVPRAYPIVGSPGRN